MQKGMTLIEILVVIAIIGIIATVVAVSVVGFLTDAKTESAGILVDNVAESVVSYGVAHRRLPDALDELVEGRYLKAKQLKDPWGHPLTYAAEIGDPAAARFEVCSAGPDQLDGSDDDICARP